MSGFTLESDWLLQQPIDYEHKTYVLLSYLKKCEDSFGRGELYPGMIEISFHLANAMALNKKNNLLTLEQILLRGDDEIITGFLKPKPLPKLNVEDNLNLIKIGNFYLQKMLEYFTTGKMMWEFVFDSTHLEFGDDGPATNGYLFYRDHFNKKTHVWEYSIETPISVIISNNVNLEPIYTSNRIIKDINRIIKKHGTIPPSKKISVIEGFSEQNFPLKETLVPMFRRKLTTYLYQSNRLKA